MSGIEVPALVPGLPFSLGYYKLRLSVMQFTDSTAVLSDASEAEGHESLLLGFGPGKTSRSV